MNVSLHILLIYRYWIIYPLAILEGPVLMTFCGFLLRLGYLNFWPLYSTLIIGDLTGDAIWYWVGHRFADPFTKRFGKFFGMTPEFMEKVRTTFQKHQNKILLFSKLTMGFGFAPVVLFSAGMSRISFSKFILFNLGGQLVWTGLLLALGYGFGDFYLTINKGFQLVSLVSFLVLVALAIAGLANYYRRSKFFDQP